MNVRQGARTNAAGTYSARSAKIVRPLSGARISGQMDDLRKYAIYALKGIASVPLVLAAGQAAMRYDEAVGDSRWLDDPQCAAAVEAATADAMVATGLFAALWSRSE